MGFSIEEMALPDLLAVLPDRFGDQRGFFSETYSRRAMAEAGITVDFVQDNHSLSAARHTLRGLHFQAPPHAQCKLVRVTRGAVLDVVVDIRHGSPGFGRHVTQVLSAENWLQLLVPPGFAHGFLTLEPDTEVLYKVDEYYTPSHDAGIAWNDPDLAIDWGLGAHTPMLSEKDRVLPRLRDLPRYFTYGEASA
ncbi:MAG TPA: dTDP-4-dehydrorhamnose 3,5-epimerase [Stellaceae bacterium]|nr:dTDP-4-dehydrorhamnose 3,5-epimerase [Stellaceae bacterium]